MTQPPAEKTGKRTDRRHEKVEETTTVEYEVPDGGYGWVVVLSAFIFISLPMGISSSFGIYYEEWGDYFNAGKVRTSLVGSVLSGCVPLLGSLGGMILINLFNDIRLVGIIGCIVSSIGFTISYFVEDIGLLAFTYGGLGGFGMGLMFNCAYLSVGYYFDKRRSLATALASSGTGFGTLISRVIAPVVDTYSWRGSLLILAAICIQCTVFGAIIRPLYAKKVAKKPAMSAVEEVLRKPITADNLEVTETGDDVNCRRNMFSSHDGIFRPDSTSDRNPFASHMHISQVSGRRHGSALNRSRDGMKLNPYMREDIFFEGSAHDVAKLSSKCSSTQKCKDNESMHTDMFISQITIDDLPVHKSNCSKLKDILKKIFKPVIFKNPTFYLIVLGMTLHHSAFFIPYTYAISLMKEKMIPEDTSTYLIICFGLSNFVNKLWIGRVMTWFNVEQLYVVIVTLTLGATAASLLTACEEFYQFVLAAILYGGTSPIISIYVTNMLVRYIGIENLTSTFSITTIIRGIGTLLGPPFAAYVIDQMGSTRYAFYVGSAGDCLAAIIFIIVLFINRDSVSKCRTCHSRDDDSIQDDSSCEEDKGLSVPAVIVTVPTEEGNLDKMIHYSSECFDSLVVRDQQEHIKTMKQRVSNLSMKE